eukprot:COSAG01_NODE_15872_length_1290_cov_1.345928_2_plen_124_part_00
MHVKKHCACLAEGEGALPPGTFERTTRPAIHSAIAAVHKAVAAQIRDGELVWCGVDFLVAHTGKPWLLEFNIKPYSRYLHEMQFESPVALQIARCALKGFVELVTARVTGQQAGGSTQWTLCA